MVQVIKLQKPMTDEEYVHENCVCPFCKNDEVQWGETEMGAEAYQEAYCYVCGAEWHDKYRLVGYVVTRKPS